MKNLLENPITTLSYLSTYW